MNVLILVYDGFRGNGTSYYLKEDHRSYTRNFCSSEKKAWKKSGLYGIRALDLCDTGAALYKHFVSSNSFFNNTVIKHFTPHLTPAWFCLITRLFINRTRLHSRDHSVLLTSFIRASSSQKESSLVINGSYRKLVSNNLSLYKYITTRMNSPPKWFAYYSTLVWILLTDENRSVI